MKNTETKARTKPGEVRKASRRYPALHDRIAEAGFTKAEIWAALGMSRQTADSRLYGRSPWRQNEIEILAAELGLTYEEIGRMFFYNRGRDQWGPDGR